MQPLSRRRLLPVCIMAVREAISDQRQIANDNAANAPEYSAEAQTLSQQWSDLLPALCACAQAPRTPFRDTVLSSLGNPGYHLIVVALRHALISARSRIIALDGAAKRDARKDYRAYDRVLTHLKGHLPEPAPDAASADPRDIIRNAHEKGLFTPHPDGGLVYKPTLPE